MMTDRELADLRSCANAATDGVTLHPFELHRLLSEVYRLRAVVAATEHEIVGMRASERALRAAS